MGLIYEGRAATQRFACHFAIDGHVATEKEIFTPHSDKEARMHGMVHSEHEVYFPWLEVHRNHYTNKKFGLL